MALTGACVLVIGAGIIGRSTAYFLARQGAQVILLDEGIAAGSPTSRASLGVLTHCNGGDNPYAQLFRDGHALHARLARDLAEDLGADVGWRPLGGIELFADPAQLEEVWHFNRARGCRVERLDERALRDAEPALDGGGEGLYFADDHRVDPLKLGAALWAAAVRQGASAAWGERVWRIAQVGEIVEVATTRGTHCADFAVLAAGAWTGDLAAQLGARVALRPVRGQQARFAGAPLRHLVRINACPVPRHGGRHFIPDGGETIVGSTVEEVGFRLATTCAAATQFVSEVRSALGRCLPLSRQQAGLRPKPRGGRPLIGPLTDAPRVFVASGHYKNGVLLGPITGQIVARWIAEGTPGRDMRRFAPER